ncbi:hypothetical protein A9G24_11310 [Gilliamella sp. App6-5]|uniref:hypothetical protein n=1 Tax=Gilliamella sp. App6-5 TaxID=3120232 RepID=UPI00080E4E1E|nr:hypothetical protein [Gilliamella apicola]OCG18824.1 hypothetical protein A9G24_11310 [Gilliamella apicola]
MYCTGATSITCESSSNDKTIETTVKAGTRKLENILIRRIPKRGINPGHYWIEIVHKDENEMDDFIVEAKKKGLKEKHLKGLDQTVKKINGFRESYGWYPISNSSFNNISIVDIFTRNSRCIKNKGCVNGDHKDRRKEDENRDLNYKIKRIAGRSKLKNDLSTIAFDCSQHRRFDSKNPITLTTNPYLLSGDVRTEEQIIEQIRNFTTKFEKNEPEWSWNGDGFDETNCHTMLFLLLASCNLADPECIGKGLDPHFTAYQESLNDKDQLESKYQERKSLITKLLQISNQSNFTK